MATKKTNSKKSVVKTMTVQEFKIWINALATFQADDWHPNKEQWEHIYQMIEKLEAGTIVQQREFKVGETVLPANASQIVDPRFHDEQPRAIPAQRTGMGSTFKAPTGVPSSEIIEPFTKSDFV
jgi:hypothetical protein